MKLRNMRYAGKILAFGFGVVDVAEDGTFTIEDEAIACDIGSLQGFELIKETTAREVVSEETLVEEKFVKPKRTPRT